MQFKLILAGLTGLVILSSITFLTLNVQQPEYKQSKAQVISSTTPQVKKVSLLVYNPVIESAGGQKLVQLKGWNDPQTLSQTLVDGFTRASGNHVNYQIVEFNELDSYPVKSDGFTWTDDTYLACVGSGGTKCHSPDTANYQQMLAAIDACGKRNSGLLDEVWIWGGPWFGFWESNLTGPGAFWYNSTPTAGTTCTKLLPVMGFNYERGEAEALESYGHRVEATMEYVYGSWQPVETHAWNRFTLLDMDVPGSGGCGNAHLAVNASTKPYDRENQRTVSSSCEDFLNYPNLTGTRTDVNCSAWGCNAAGYLKWWYAHLPQAPGFGPDGKLNNWWDYIAGPQQSLNDTVVYSGLTANLLPNQAVFNFNFSGGRTNYLIDLSTTSDMSWDVYMSFGSGQSSPITVSGPQTKWDKYTCGKTLYWRVRTNNNQLSPIQTGLVECPLPSVSPSPSPSPSPAVLPTPTPSPLRFVNIIQPNGGETLVVGQTYRITWESSANIDKVLIGYSFGPGSLSWIATNIPNTNYYDWNVSIGNTINTRVKIDLTGFQTGVGSAHDVSDDFFSVLKSYPSPTPAPSPSPTPEPVVQSMTPIADAMVKLGDPQANFGKHTKLKTDGKPVEMTYLKFDLTPFSGKTVLSAKLAFRVANSSLTAQSVSYVPDNSWGELTLNYNNRPLPAIDVSLITPISLVGFWKEVDVTQAVLSGQGQFMTLLFEALPSSFDNLSIYSRESNSKPQLKVIYY